MTATTSARASSAVRQPTMKAIVQDRYGSADGLTLDEIAAPAIAADQVLVRVRATSLDPGIWHLMTGLPYLVRLMGYGLRRPKQRVPGMAVAGVVEAVGEGVTKHQPGDEVFGWCTGGLAEYAAAHEDHFLPKPKNLTLEQASAVPISGMAALQAVRNKGRVQAGQKVLVIGAAGGVGNFAVQIAKAFGAEVTGVCSPSKVDVVRSIGADHVTDYSREDFAAAGPRYDLIIDTAGLRSLAHLRRALRPTGTLVIVGGEGGGRWLGGIGRVFKALVLSPFTKQRLLGMFSVERREDLAALSELIESGKVTPFVDRTYPLAEAANAIRYQAAGHTRGKLVITV